MPFLSAASTFDEVVEKATLETQTSENWALILEICDKVSQGGTRAAKDCLLSIKKRLNHRDPHVTLLAFSVLDSCMSNCGRVFHSEACSREFISELRSKATTSNPNVGERARMLIKKWSEEFRKEGSCSAIESLYSELRKDGYEFAAPDQARKLPQSVMPADPSFVTSQQEADDIAKAIQLSLQDNSSGRSSHSETKSGTSGALYPLGSTTTVPSPQKVVRALYDFEAVEDNELTFKAGELVTVTDDSDVNWWKGQNHRGQGLFPASFVTADLATPVESDSMGASKSSNRKSVQFDENVEVKHVEPEQDVQIDDEKLSRCLELLQNADPTGVRPDSEELLQLESQANAMFPLIDAELGSIDCQHNLLAEVNAKLMDGLNLYHGAMKDASSLYQYQQQQTMHVQPLSSGAQYVYPPDQRDMYIQQHAQAMPVGFPQAVSSGPYQFLQPASQNNVVNQSGLVSSSAYLPQTIVAPQHGVTAYPTAQ